MFLKEESKRPFQTDDERKASNEQYLQTPATTVSTAVAINNAPTI